MQNTHLRLTVLTASMTSLFAPALYAASAGQVDFATAGVNAIGPNGQSRPLTKGAEVQPGETIDTGSGRAQLRFTDGGFVSLQPQTQFRLEQYGYDKDDPKKNGIVMNLLKGGLRTITGLIGKTNREGYKLQTATATVGIRGTEFSITGFPDGSIIFHVSDGAIDVSNTSGSTTVPSGSSVQVSSNTSAPKQTDEKPFLPPSVSGAQTQIAAPPNAVQDSQGISAPLLVGTYEGAWRVNSSGQMINFNSNNGNVFYAGYGGAPGTMKSTFTVSPSGHAVDFKDAYVGGYGATVTNFQLSLGSASAQSYGNDGVMAWGRWIGSATATGGNYEGQPNFTADNPLHYVVGMPAVNVPTSGSATYNMYGGTAPSCSGASCGGAISVGGSLTVNFASYNGNFALNFANAADGVKASATGGISFPNNQRVNFNGNTSFTSTAGPTSYGSAYLSGFLAGNGATHAGAVYSINYNNINGTTNINGAAVYKK